MGNRLAWDAQAFAEFRLQREPPFAGAAGGLRNVSGKGDFKTGFNAHAWDEFADKGPFGIDAPYAERLKYSRKVIGQTCIGCHRFPGVYSFNSFHGEFPDLLQRKLNGAEDDVGHLPKSHELTATEVGKVEQAAASWKEVQLSWKALKSLLPK